MKKTGIVLFIVLAIVLILLTRTEKRGPQISLSDFQVQLMENEVAWVEIRQDDLVGELREAKSVQGVKIRQFSVALPPGMSASWPFVQWLLDNRHDGMVLANSNAGLLMTLVVPLIPWLLIFSFIWYFVFRTLRKAQQQRREPVQVVLVNSPSAAAAESPAQPR